MTLSRERIVEAALDLVAEEGLDGLSMRKVAGRLGVEAMSLYRHVRDKGDLLDALQDALLARVPIPDDGPWPDAIRTSAGAFRDVLFAHPRLVPLLATRPGDTPHGQRLIEAGIALLERHGFPTDTAVVAFQTVFVFVVGHAVFHTAQDGADDPWARDAFVQGLDVVVAGLQATRGAS